MLKGTILIVDDEEQFRSQYRKLLESQGYKVHEAEDAVEVANQLMKIASDLDLILLDINIAEVDGRDISEIVEEYNPRIKMIVTSVYPVKEQKFKVPRAHDYHDKADNDSVLLKKIQNQISLGVA